MALQLVETTNELAQLSEDDLLTQLGALLVGDAAALQRDGERSTLITRAQNWLERTAPELRDGLCNSDLADTLQGDGPLEIAAIADLITDIRIGAPGVLTIAAIIAKRGIAELCNET